MQPTDFPRALVLCTPGDLEVRHPPGPLPRLRCSRLTGLPSYPLCASAPRVAMPLPGPHPTRQRWQRGSALFLPPTYFAALRPPPALLPDCHVPSRPRSRPSLPPLTPTPDPRPTWRYCAPVAVVLQSGSSIQLGQPSSLSPGGRSAGEGNRDTDQVHTWQGPDPGP